MILWSRGCCVGLGGARGCSLPACVGRGRRTLCKRLWRAFGCGVACVGMFGVKVAQIAS